MPDSEQPAPSRRTDPIKVRKASLDPERPGLDCRAEPGAWVPQINHAACEAKRDCVEVCPYDVFEVRRIDDVDYAKLGFLPKLKVRVHGMKTAYTPNADACRACGLCVVACPEDAITLVALKEQRLRELGHMTASPSKKAGRQ